MVTLISLLSYFASLKKIKIKISFQIKSVCLDEKYVAMLTSGLESYEYLYYDTSHETMLRSTMLCSTMLCSTMLCSTMLRSTMLRSTMLCSTMLCSTMLCSTMLCSTMLCSTMLRSTMLCSTMLRSTMLCSTMLCVRQMQYNSTAVFSVQTFFKYWQLFSDKQNILICWN